MKGFDRSIKKEGSKLLMSAKKRGRALPPALVRKGES